MGYTQFVLSAGKWALGKQKYLFKAWKEAEKLGKPILESHFPKLLNKAKDYYKNFKGFDPKVIQTTRGMGDLFPRQLKKIAEKVRSGKPTPKSTGPGQVIPFPKKPPGKADGGRIDKPLPTRSRDI